MPAQLVVALDVPSAKEIPAILSKLPATLDWYKVGLELFIADGPAALSLLHDANKKIFLDLKLHDIPRTVAHAVSRATDLGVTMLTIHASGGEAMIKAAADAAKANPGNGSPAPHLIAVTVLTSLNESDLTQLGISRSAAEETQALASLALTAGADGLVCSPHEAAAMRSSFGTAPLLITPGIRPSGTQAGDQKRFATPADAVRAGASFLVVGRPVLDAADPGAAAAAIVDEMAAASN